MIDKNLRDHRDSKDLYQLLYDKELQHHLVQFKNDFYKQVFYNHKDCLLVSDNRSWARTQIKFAAGVQSNKGHSGEAIFIKRIPFEMYWYHSIMHLSKKMLRETEDSTLCPEDRAHLKVILMQLQYLVLQVESNEFSAIFMETFV